MSSDSPIRNAALRYRGRTALICGEEILTFEEVDKLVDRLAGGLASELTPGDRVGLYMTNRAEFLLLQFAIERAGLVRVPLNYRYTTHEVMNLLSDCQASAVFCDESTIDSAVGARTAIDLPLWLCDVENQESSGGPSWMELLESDPINVDIGAANLDAPSSINYTSGSSGRPKGVVLGGRQWRSVYRNMLIDRDIRSDDVVAHIGPLTHASGTYAVPFFLRGATNLIVKGSSVEALFGAIENHRVTGFTCVPTVLTRIVNHPELNSYDLSSLRWIGCGAEACPITTLDKVLDRFGAILTQNYGLTEAMMTCTYLSSQDMLGDDGKLRVASIGRPYTFVDVVVRDSDGHPVGPGKVGELTVRAEHLMQGYWNLAEETEQAIREGWLWSGDLARCDEDGFITLVGRQKEMLISGGFNIYPQEVEGVLNGCPGVTESAVFGIPDLDFGEIAVAYVALEPDSELTEKEIVGFCKPFLGIKTPKRWMMTESLPKNPNGKVDKGSLKSNWERVTAKSSE